jgi:ABC-type Zn2+ transport system substrate-binding protein/surface adhesin
LSIQILQYEFLGPIPITEWGPPMEKLVFLILSRNKDKFDIVYVGDCQKTDDKSFFTSHKQFKCWIKQSGSEQSLYLAILPLFESPDEKRINVIRKILSQYKPHCNSNDIPKSTPDYSVRVSDDNALDSQKITCLGCGSKMNLEKTLEKSSLYRCISCGLSDTRLNS